MSEPVFVAQVSRWRTGLLVLAAGGFVVLGTIMVVDPDTGLIARAFGLFCAMFFGLAGVIGVRQLARGGPEIIIHDGGVLSRRWSDTPVPWSAVERAAVGKVRGQSFICLWLHDPAAYPSTSRLRGLGGMNKAMGFGDITLSATGTDRSASELAEAVAAHVPLERG